MSDTACCAHACPLSLMAATDTPRKPFSMIREFHLADWFTLGNAICGTGALFSVMTYLQAQDVPAERIRYYPNSAEALYQPVTVEPQAAERGLLPQGFRVMFAGNIGAAQDFETIIAAADRLRNEKNIHWVIVGDGRLQPWLDHEIEHRGLRGCVHLLGRHPVQSMPRFFALANVMLVTLKDDPIFALTVPSKVQSYLACGRPVLAALDGEGARVVREAGAGLAVKAGDATALAEAVLRLHRMSAEEREAMGRRGSDYFARHFERSLLIDQLEAWGRELAERQCAS